MQFIPHLFCRHGLFTFQEFCACVDDTFLVSNESHDNRCRDSEKQWSEVSHKERFLCISISRFTSLIFLSTSAALNISSFYQLFVVLEILCPYLGASDFGRPPFFWK